MKTFLFLICMTASTLGAVCGIGGGILIKPVMEMASGLDAALIHFLSSFTVLSMSGYSVCRLAATGEGKIQWREGTLLAAGAAVGGVLGKQCFGLLLQAGSEQRLLVLQSLLLITAVAGTLAYMKNKDRIKTLRIKRKPAVWLVGMGLGALSSFLGIGGGPMNLVVLNYFFSMKREAARQNSLYVILCSQAVSVMTTVLTGSLSSLLDGKMPWLLMMSAGGIAGAVLGRHINQRITDRTADRLFSLLMYLIVFICVFNAGRALAV